jgi:DNA-binding response OmpR family regulator
MADKVLLVENDELLGILFELALCEAGYEVARTANGADALVKLDATSPVDLLVTDIGLGDGPNGWQVARRARARCPEMPVIYMTGARADEWRPQSVPMGVLLLKPFPIDQLVEMVGQLLAARTEMGAKQLSA